jgi:cytosine/adenosine deaminase-related metal-dependent hydrolase
LAQYFADWGEFSRAGAVFTPNDIYVGQLAGLYDALYSGVTIILDHAHHTWSEETSLAGLNASIDSGARVFWSYAFHPLKNGFSIDDQMDVYQEIYKNGAYKDSNVELGIAYDFFHNSNNSEVESVIKLAKYVADHFHARFMIIIANIWCLSRDTNVSVVTSHYIGGPFSCK